MDTVGRCTTSYYWQGQCVCGALFNLGFALLCTTSDDQLLMEKQFDVVKIKFHLNDNIE